jgi:SGNH hydrolase-like domain, acetyltransferase AlgX
MTDARPAWRSRLVRLAVFALILVAEFAVLEAGMRVAGGSEASPSFLALFMTDPGVGHRLRPGARSLYRTVEFTTDLRINAQGVRDDEDIGPKAANERRVVILGDSLVLSVQVPLAETFGKRLEAKLNAADPAHHWRVINAGVQGYCPVEEWFFFDRIAAAFQPDLVIVAPFVANDAVESNDRESWLDAGHPPEVTASAATLTWLRRLARASMVVQNVRLRIDLLKSRLTTPGPERPLTSYLADPPPDVIHGLEVSRRSIDLIAKRANAIGAKTALVLMPARFQTDDADYGRLDETVRQAGGVLVRNSASERFTSALAPLGLPMLDLQPILAAQPDRVGLFFQRNVHFTPRGHAVAADAIFSFLREQALIR